MGQDDDASLWQRHSAKTFVSEPPHQKNMARRLLPEKLLFLPNMPRHPAFVSNAAMGVKGGDMHNVRPWWRFHVEIHA